VSHPTRVAGVEGALVGTPLNAAAIDVAASHTPADLGDEVTGDLFASAEYRAAVAPVYVSRAVVSAAARAGLA